MPSSPGYTAFSHLLFPRAIFTQAVFFRDYGRTQGERKEGKEGEKKKEHTVVGRKLHFVLIRS